MSMQVFMANNFMQVGTKVSTQCGHLAMPNSGIFSDAWLFNELNNIYFYVDVNLQWLCSA